MAEPAEAPEINLDQKDRLIQVFAQDFGPNTKLALKGVIGREGISTLFNYRLQIISNNKQLRAEQFVGTNIDINLETDPKKHTYRPLNGFVSRFYIGEEIRKGKFRLYELEVVPWLWFLQLRSDCRIFQDMTVVDVILQIFKDNKLTDIDRANLDVSGFPKLEYCVQYRETCFDFVSRLMEEYGIFYFFRHHEGRHTLVMANRNTAFEDIAKKEIHFGSLEESKQTQQITSWQHSFEHKTGRWVHTDYNFEKPKAEMLAKRNTSLKVPPGNPWERFDYPGRYKELKDGETLAQIRIEEEEARHHIVEGEGNHREFTAGGAFMIDKHERQEDDKVRFVLTAVEFTAIDNHYTQDNFWDTLLKSLPGLLIEIGKGAGGAVAGAFFEIFKQFNTGLTPGLKNLASTLISGVRDPLDKWAEDRRKSFFDTLEPGYSNHFICSPVQIPVRPPRTTRKPVIAGPQTAFVVGPEGKEIWPDKFGRVRVHFHWDTYGEPKQGNTSCWMRVSEGWAGRQWGYQHVPRVGQEVIVTFLEGDPDRPIITGRVYNGDNKHPFDLPQYQTRSGLKTNSTPLEKGSKGGYHMLRFEDAWGKEQILLRSQLRTDVRTLGSYYETTHANRHLLIGYHDDETKKQGGSFYGTIGDEWNLHVNGGRYEGIEKQYHLRVTQNFLESFEANQSTLVGGVAEWNAKTIRLEALTKISLKVGGSFVVIDPSGVAINGPMVRINSGGAADATSSVDIVDPIDASVSDNGEPGYLEELYKKAERGGGGGGWNGHHVRHVSAQHGPNVTRNADGTLQFSPGIRVDASNPDAASATIQDLAIIGSTPSGQALFSSLDSSGKTVTIAPGNPPPNPPNAFAAPGTSQPNDFAAATPAGQPVFNGAGQPVNDPAGNQLTGTGTGTNSNVTYNPNQWPDPTTAHKAPGDVILFHELTHADNMEHGRYDGTPRTDNFDTNEERNTIGPENKYRDERGVPRRNDHHDL